MITQIICDWLIKKSIGVIRKKPSTSKAVKLILPSGTEMCEPEGLDKWGEVLAVIYYPKDRAMAYRNAAISEKAVIANYHGRNIGYTEKIDRFEGKWNERNCVGLMKFESPTQVRRWLESDHMFRQPDFLDRVEIFMVPLSKKDMSREGYPILELSQVDVNFMDLYENQYLPNLECLVKKFGGIPLLVHENQPWKWRGFGAPGSIIINQWPDWQNYDRFSVQEDHKKLSEMRKTIGDGYKIATHLFVDM